MIRHGEHHDLEDSGSLTSEHREMRKYRPAWVDRRCFKMRGMITSLKSQWVRSAALGFYLSCIANLSPTQHCKCWRGCFWLLFREVLRMIYGKVNGSIPLIVMLKYPISDLSGFELRPSSEWSSIVNVDDWEAPWILQPRRIAFLRALNAACMSRKCRL